MSNKVKLKKVLSNFYQPHQITQITQISLHFFVMSSIGKMMSNEIEKLINLGLQDNKINRTNDAIEMLDDKKTYYWLEKLNGINFDMVCINKIFRAEIEKLKNKENDTKKSGK